MRTTIRQVKFKNGKEAIIADWYYGQHASELYTEAQYATLTDYIKDISGDFMDESYMSDGECLDLSMELYDKGIAYL